MRYHDLKTVKLFILALVFLVGAVACIPDGYFGISVNMDDQGVTDNGVAYDKNDILFQPTILSTDWGIAFDGELYGLTDKKHDISAFSYNEFISTEVPTTPTADEAYVNVELYLSFEANRARVSDVDDWVMGQDIVKFTELISGTETTHAFEMFFDGSDVGLTTNAEKVDGITVWPEDDYLGAGSRM